MVLNTCVVSQTESKGTNSFTVKFLMLTYLKICNGITVFNDK